MERTARRLRPPPPLQDVPWGRPSPFVVKMPTESISIALKESMDCVDDVVISGVVDKGHASLNVVFRRG